MSVEGNKADRSKLPALAVTALLLTVITITWAGQAGIFNQASNPLMVQSDTQYPARLLSFVDQVDGSVEVLDGNNQSIVMVYRTGEGSFLRGVLRTLTRERRVRGFGMDQPFELRAESANRLYLIDQATGTTLLLNAFGPDNVAVFEELLYSPVVSDT